MLSVPAFLVGIEKVVRSEDVLVWVPLRQHMGRQQGKGIEEDE